MIKKSFSLAKLNKTVFLSSKSRFNNQYNNIIIENPENNKRKISEFVESQKRISNLKSVRNEKEVRLMEVEGKSLHTKSKKSANDGRTSPPDSMAATTIK